MVEMGVGLNSGGRTESDFCPMLVILCTVLNCTFRKFFKFFGNLEMVIEISNCPAIIDIRLKNAYYSFSMHIYSFR